MKRITIIFLLLIILTGCSNNSDGSSNEKSLNLDGTYQLVENSDTSTYTTTATIEGDKITILIGLNSDTLNLEETFWIGSVDQPKNDKQPYSWTSKLDKEALDKAENPLPPQTEELNCSYDNNKLTFKFSNGGNQGESELTLDKIS